MSEIIKKTQKMVAAHNKWRSECINLIASENYSSEIARKLYCSDIMHRYAYWDDNNIHTRYYQGNKYIMEIELQAIEVAKELFDANYVEIRPVSGMSANLGVILGVTNPGDLIIEPGRDIGGHRTVTKLITSKVIKLMATTYPIDLSTYNIDLEKTAQIVEEKKPKLMTLGASIFLFPHPVKEIVKMAEKVGAYVSYDASHVLGLIAGGSFQKPLAEKADFMLGSTHKTFAGPQGGIVLSNEHDLSHTLKLCPNFVDSHHPHRIPMLIATMAEYLEFGKDYAKQVISNAKALGKGMYDEGFNVLFKNLSFTESHSILVDVSEFGDGKSIAIKLEEANIITNKMQVPDDIIQKRLVPTGIRIGTQEMTRFGMKEIDMKEIARLIRRLLIDKENTHNIKRDVVAFRKQFNKIQYCF